MGVDRQGNVGVIAVATSFVYDYTKIGAALVSSREILQRLQSAGWVVDRQKGSHVQLKHPAHPNRRVTVPHPNRDLKLGTLKSIERQCGLTLRPRA
jgi:predicted RNA binding protein YcfA (HicA-like mRNA interferase family)